MRLLSGTIIAFFSVLTLTQGQEVTTIYGDPGNSGVTDNATPASEASFNYPYAAIYNADGDIIISDQENHNLSLVRADDDSIFVFGGLEQNFGYNEGPTSETTATLNMPAGVVAHPDENTYYFADRDNYVIRKAEYQAYDEPNAMEVHDFSLVAGSPQNSGFEDGTGEDAMFGQPQSIVMDNDGYLYVSDQTNHSIRKVDTETGEVTTIAGNGQSGDEVGSGNDAQFDSPQGIAVGNDGYLYVSDYGNNKIKRINLDTEEVEHFAGGDNVIDAEDSQDGPIDGDEEDIATFYGPSGIAIDDEDIIYVITNAGTVRAIYHDSVHTFVGQNGQYGNEDGTGENASIGSDDPFDSAEGQISLSHDHEYLLFADYRSHTIRTISIEGPRNAVSDDDPDPNSIAGSIEQNDLNIYPNPAENVLNIEGSNLTSDSEVRVLTLHGQEAATGSFNNNQIDVSGLNNGMYIVEVKTPHHTYHEKFEVK